MPLGDKLAQVLGLVFQAVDDNFLKGKRIFPKQEGVLFQLRKAPEERSRKRKIKGGMDHVKFLQKADVGSFHLD